MAIIDRVLLMVSGVRIAMIKMVSRAMAIVYWGMIP